MNKMEVIKCEFCSEFILNEEDSTFNKIYSGILKKRIISESASFVITPTIGQLFKESLLIIPKFHIETLSGLSMEIIIELEEILMKIKPKFSRPENVVAFEHGAFNCNNGGCGIYHAHLHVIPLPEKIFLSSFFKHPYNKYSSLRDAISPLKKFDDYLMAIEQDGSFRVLKLNSEIKHEYSSQYFRRALADYFSLSNSWDWRKYNFPEPFLIESVEARFLPSRI